MTVISHIKTGNSGDAGFNYFLALEFVTCPENYVNLPFP